MKKRLILCFLIVFALCVCILAGCSEDPETPTEGGSLPIDDVTIGGLLQVIKSEAQATAHSAKTYFNLDGSVQTTDADGNPLTVCIEWKKEGESSVTVAKGDDGNTVVLLPQDFTEELHFSLRATLVDAQGNAFVDRNGNAYSVAVDCTVPVPTSGGEGGGSGTEPGGSGTEPGGSGTEPGGGTQGGGSTTPGDDQETTISIDFSQQNYGNEQEATDVTVSGITVAFDAGTNSYAPKWYNNGGSVRLYGGNTVTISGATITKVVVHFGTLEYDTNEIVPNVGTFQTDTWTGSTDNLVLTISGTSGNRRITSLDITFGGSAGGGSTTPGGGGTQGGGSGSQGGGTQSGNVIVVDFTAQGYTTATAVAESQTISGLNFRFAKGSNSSTAASYYENKNGNHLRLYADNTMTISGQTITKVVFTFAKYDESNPITVDVGTFSGNTWTGSADSISFHVGENEKGWHGHRRIVSVAITLADGSGSQGGTTPGEDSDVGSDEEYFEGNPSTDWSAHNGTYTLYEFIEDDYDMNPDVVVKVVIESDKISITLDGETTVISAEEIEYFTDCYFYGFTTDDFWFYWQGEEFYLSVYDDGSLELGGDTSTYVTENWFLE